MSRMIKRVGAALSIIGAVAVASACSSIQEKPQVSNPGIDYDLIVDNLLDVIGSDERMHYTNTTYQIVKPRTPIGQALFDKLSEKGYGVQLVSGDVGKNFIRYRVGTLQTEQGIKEVYSLAVQNIRAEREYALIDGRTVPTSPVTLLTDLPAEVEVDDSLFGVNINSETSRVVVVDGRLPEASRVSALEDVKIENPAEIAASANGAVRGRDFANRPATVAISNVRNLDAIGNVHDLGESNFSSVFKQYDDISNVTLIFPNDSLFLGDRNSEILKTLAQEINPSTDIISIIGCSHGRTALENGNQLLAEGRTERVAESLLFAGVQQDLILTEACWADEYWDEHAPRRGVMVTHKRLSPQG